MLSPSMLCLEQQTEQHEQGQRWIHAHPSSAHAAVPVLLTSLFQRMQQQMNIFHVHIIRICHIFPLLQQ